MKDKYTLVVARAVIDSGLKNCENCPEFEGVHDCSLDCWEDVALPCAKIVIDADAERVKELELMIEMILDGVYRGEIKPTTVIRESKKLVEYYERLAKIMISHNAQRARIND